MWLIYLFPQMGRFWPRKPQVKKGTKEASPHFLQGESRGRVLPRQAALQQGSRYKLVVYTGKVVPLFLSFFHLLPLCLVLLHCSWDVQSDNKAIVPSWTGLNETVQKKWHGKKIWQIFFTSVRNTAISSVCIPEQKNIHQDIDFKQGVTNCVSPFWKYKAQISPACPVKRKCT